LATFVIGFAGLKLIVPIETLIPTERGASRPQTEEQRRDVGAIIEALENPAGGTETQIEVPARAVSSRPSWCERHHDK
jgi:hypothetical protein